MTSATPIYHRSIDLEALMREFPPAPECEATIYRLPSEQIRDIQQRRFLEQVARAWQIPFYRRHWGEAGLEPGDIATLDDLSKLPTFDVEDLRRSIERAPPWGEHTGIDWDNPIPLVLQTSGGTTGLPRPMLYGPRDREVQNIMAARRLYMQEVRAGDRVQITMSLGLTNAGTMQRESIWKYTGAIPITTGAGNTTSTRRQIEILRAWHVNVLAGFPSYLRHMAHVARDEFGFAGTDAGLKSIITHLGLEDRTEIERLWGCPVYDSYGFNEVGTIAGECRHQSGMHIFEDAFVVEVGDPETHAPRPDGERGTVLVTALYKQVAPIIRFNSNDVSCFSRNRCACGNTHRSLERIFGRSDNMIKLRGVNVFPEAVGVVVAREPSTNGEFLCVVDRVGADGHDEMTVMIEALDSVTDRPGLQHQLAERLRETLGVRIAVDIVNAGELDRHTGLTQTSKIKRVLDRRTQPPAMPVR